MDIRTISCFGPWDIRLFGNFPNDDTHPRGGRHRFPISIITADNADPIPLEGAHVLNFDWAMDLMNTFGGLVSKKMYDGGFLIFFKGNKDQLCQLYGVGKSLGELKESTHYNSTGYYRFQIDGVMHEVHMLDPDYNELCCNALTLDEKVLTQTELDSYSSEDGYSGLCIESSRLSYSKYAVKVMLPEPYNKVHVLVNLGGNLKKIYTDSHIGNPEFAFCLAKTLGGSIDFHQVEFPEYFYDKEIKKAKVFSFSFDRDQQGFSEYESEFCDGVKTVIGNDSRKVIFRLREDWESNTYMDSRWNGCFDGVMSGFADPIKEYEHKLDFEPEVVCVNDI